MAKRRKNKGRALLRRSSGRQEKSLAQQLEWAIKKALEVGMQLNATQLDLQYMQERKLSHYKDIYVDDAITGADLKRPGLTGLRTEALNDPSISHLFIYLPDRFARPEEPLEAALMEIQLRKAGITIEFSNRTGLPRQQGENHFADDVQLLFQYSQAGQYLVDLAQRVLEGHALCAKEGGWTGGRAPYGHQRVLVDSAGNIIQELEDGMIIRKPGCRVKIRPNDEAKIRIWVMIFHWYFGGKLGGKRIARQLNELGIPSPDAGRTRTDHGVAHKVSGKWSASTVLSLIRNRAIIGLKTYGVQAEGVYRRLGKQGPRLLEDKDMRDNTPRVVQNDPSLIIVKSTGFEPSADVELFNNCQAQLEERGRTQRGISRRRDPARYPLALRVWDMSPGCGHPMYARTVGSRVLYVCGLYEKTAGARCEHNAVDGEAALSFVLKALLQQVERLGGRDALRARLIKLVATPKDAAQKDDLQHQLRQLDQRLIAAKEKQGIIDQNFVFAKDESERELFRKARAHQQTEIERLCAHQAELKSQASKVQKDDPNAQVDAALALYDNMQVVLKDPTARAAIQVLLGKINLNLWLSFGEGVKGKRTIRQLRGGILTTGDAKPPIRPFGDDHDGDGPDGGRGGAGMLPAPVGVSDAPSVDSVSPLEDVSFRMVNRGDSQHHGNKGTLHWHSMVLVRPSILRRTNERNTFCVDFFHRTNSHCA